MPAPFVNWAQTVAVTPARVARPRDEAALGALVRSARRAGERIKVVGAGHSWSSIAATTGTQIRIDHMDAIIGLDSRAGVVRVGAGKTLNALVAELERVGYALPILGSIAEQTLAGAIATGTHGSSLKVGNLASLVRRMVLIDGTGERRVLEGPMLEGARVHLGALGVVTELDLAVVPHFKLRETLTHGAFDAIAEQIPALAAAHDFVKVVWLPHTDHLMVFAYTKTRDAGDVSDLAWQLDAAVSRSIFPRLLALGGRFPALIPHHNRLVAALKFKPATRVGRSHRLFGFPFVPPHRETEMAIPLTDAPAAAGWLRGHLAHGKGQCDFIMELRFVPADPAWLSPAYGRDTCQLGVYAARSPGIDTLFRAFRDAATRAWSGRPHWGKELDPVDLARLYPRASDFRALAHELDPDGVFRNAFLDAVL